MSIMWFDPDDWENLAACKGDSAMRGTYATFFPLKGDNRGVVDAKRICATCPVRKSCLDFAMDNPGLDGVWGGLTDRERSRLRRERRRSA